MPPTRTLQRVKSESPSIKSEPDSDSESNSNEGETYEQARERQIAENQALLEGLGLFQIPTLPGASSSSSSTPIPAGQRVKREEKPVIDPASLRRTSRRPASKGQIVYNGRALKQRTSTGEFLRYQPEPKAAPPSIVYGNVPGVPVFRTWDHKSLISPTVHDGSLRVRSTSLKPAASLCLYGQGGFNSSANMAWQDSLDFGNRFTFISAYGNYTFGDYVKGIGGQVQVRDQTFDHAIHQALEKNMETGTVIRVIRGSRSNCVWAPEHGFRYDGLYKIISARAIKSPITGKQVCTFEFRRCPRQGNIPKRTRTGGRSGTGSRGGLGWVWAEEESEGDEDGERNQVEFEVADDVEVEVAERAGDESQSESELEAESSSSEDDGSAYGQNIAIAVDVESESDSDDGDEDEAASSGDELAISREEASLRLPIRAGSNVESAIEVEDVIVVTAAPAAVPVPAAAPAPAPIAVAIATPIAERGERTRCMAKSRRGRPGR